MKLLSQMTPAERRVRIAKLVKDPGTRTAVPTKYLPAKYRGMRQEAQRLKQPIVPGSSITNRDLAQQRKAAETLQFGPGAEAKQVQQGRDVGGWYDQYVAELATHRANVNAAGQQAQANLAGIGSAVRGLDQQTLQDQLRASGADAASRGAEVSGDVAKTGSDASAVRQALLGSMQGVQNAQGANATNYADTLAHVVGPGQRLQGRAVEGRKLDDLRRNMGAFRTKFEGEAKDKERAYVTAAQSLGLDTQKAKADIDLKRGVDPITGRRIVKPKSASERKTEADIAYFKKHGYYPPTGPGAKDKKPLKWASGSAQGAAQDGIGSALSFAKRFKKAGLTRSQAGEYLLAGQKSGSVPVYETKNGKQVRKLNPDGTPVMKATGQDVPTFDPVWASIALDMAFDGHVSANNVKRLHARGIRLDALGYPTRG